jgi:Domain of unknown function (DUF4440)
MRQEKISRKRTGAAQTAADSAAAAERLFREAPAHGDSVAAIALLAPDAMILESGGIETREEYRSHLPADITFAGAVPATGESSQVRIEREIAWVVSTSRTAGTFQGRPVKSQAAELVVLSRGCRRVAHPRHPLVLQERPGGTLRTGSSREPRRDIPCARDENCGEEIWLGSG